MIYIERKNSGINKKIIKNIVFEDLKAWCGLTLKDEIKSQEWWHALKRNIKPTEITYVKILLQKYGQDQLNNDPTIIIDTIHSVKGGEADNVLVYFKADYASQYQNKQT